MRACLRVLGIVIIVLAALPFVVAQEPAKKNADAKPGVKAKDDADVKDEVKKTDKTAKKKEKEKDEDLEKKAEKKEKLVYGANFTAKLKELDANSQKDFTVEVQIPVPNPDGINAFNKAMYDLQVRQAQIVSNRGLNPIQKQQQLNQAVLDVQRQLPQLQKNKYKMESKAVKVKAAENIRVRTMVLPIDYDDKGNVKKYTKKELAALRGPDKKLPGYTAEYEALHAGQIVYVYLAKNQPNPAKAKGAKAGGDGGIKLNPDDDAGAIGEQRPEVVMIVILAEPKDR